MGELSRNVRRHSYIVARRDTFKPLSKSNWHIFLWEVIITLERSLVCHQLLVFQWGLHLETCRIGWLMMIFILGLSPQAREFENFNRFTGPISDCLRLYSIAVTTPPQQKHSHLLCGCRQMICLDKCPLVSQRCEPLFTLWPTIH